MELVEIQKVTEGKFDLIRVLFRGINRQRMGKIQGRGSSDPLSCVLWTKYDKGATRHYVLRLGDFDAFEWSPFKRSAHMEQGDSLWEHICQFLEENRYVFGRVVIRVERAVQRLQIGKHQWLWRDFGVVR